MAAAVSRSLRYQNGLIDSTSMSIPIASMLFSRSSTSMKARLFHNPGRRNHALCILAHHVHRLTDVAVRVNVDGLDALAADRHRLALARGLLRAGVIQQPAAAKHDAARRA